MPLWMVERDIAGIDDERVEAAALRGLMCAHWWEGMQWLRSFRDREQQRMFCVFEARSADDVRAHSDYAGLPYVDVRPVEEVLPEQLLDRAPGAAAVRRSA